MEAMYSALEDVSATINDIIENSSRLLIKFWKIFNTYTCSEFIDKLNTFNTAMENDDPLWETYAADIVNATVEVCSDEDVNSLTEFKEKTEQMMGDFEAEMTLLYAELEELQNQLANLGKFTHSLIIHRHQDLLIY